MSFFVFDLDETLAEVYPIHYLIEPAPPPHVYRGFVKGVVEAEHGDRRMNDAEGRGAQSSPAERLRREPLAGDAGLRSAYSPLGVLRPGILPLMERLLALQRKGTIRGVVIYSNNGHLPTLHFIRDVLHEHLRIRSPLILACIHWDHPDRTDAPYREDKTWDSLQRILQSLTDAPVTPDRVYFVDDLDHPDLHAALGDHYLQVPPYTHSASFDRLLAIWEDVVGPLTARERRALWQQTDPRSDDDETPAVDARFQATMDEVLRPMEARRGGRRRRTRRHFPPRSK